MHGGNFNMKVQGITPLGYAAFVFNSEYPSDPDKKRSCGWKRPELFAQYHRGDGINYYPPTSMMHWPEFNIAGGQRGIGRIGADNWQVFKDKSGRRRGWIWERYPQSRWRNLDLESSLLAPGPDGPVATTHLEWLREGIQQCEARIAVEAVLTDPKLKDRLPPDLAKRAQDALDERITTMWKGASASQLTGRWYSSSREYAKYRTGGHAGHAWYLSSGWQERVEKLYALAGEVTRKPGSN
jgi:hypothetical protein